MDGDEMVCALLTKQDVGSKLSLVCVVWIDQVP